MKVRSAQNSLATLTALTVFLLLQGCNGATGGSETKSLNNFARGSGDVTRNICSGSNEVVMGIKSEWDHVDFSKVAPDQVDGLKQVLRQSLTAVPNNLQQVFFGIGGKIVFSSNLNNPGNSSGELACQHSAANDKFAGEGTSRVDACWVVDPQTKDVVILMAPSVEVVQHSTVRMFGYILSQVLTKLSMDDNGKLIRQDDPGFQQMLTDIGTAVVADVQKPGSKYTFAVNKSLLGTDEFKYFAFAESFDSYYCNGQLRASMAKQDEFPQTFALFLKMDAELSKIGGASSNTQDQKSGFSLANGTPEFNLGIVNMFAGIARMFGGVFRGAAGVGVGVLRAGGGLIRGAGGLLGNVVQGAGGLLGGDGGGLMSIIMRMFGGGG